MIKNILERDVAVGAVIRTVQEVVLPKLVESAGIRGLDFVIIVGSQHEHARRLAINLTRWDGKKTCMYCILSLFIRSGE